MLTLYRRNNPAPANFDRDPFFNFVDRFFGDLSRPTVPSAALSGDSQGGPTWLPAVDVVENTDAYVMTADLPGLSKDDIEISLDDGVLTLSGERRLERTVGDVEAGEKAENAKGFRRFERVQGSFRRSFSLPVGLDVEKAEAKFNDGVLTLTLPKGAVAKGRKIAIH